MGEAAALGAALCWSIAPVLFTLGGKKVPGATINRLRLVIACLCLAAAQLYLVGLPDPGALGWRQLGWLSLSGVLGLAVGDTFMLHAFLSIGPRLSTLVMTLSPPISALLAWLFFGQRMTLMECLGGMLCLAGVALVVFSHQRDPDGLTHSGERARFRKGLLFALAGALGQSLGLISAKLGLASQSSAEPLPVITAVLIRMVAATIVMWLIQDYRRSTGLRAGLDRRAFLLIATAAVIGPFLGVWLSIVAIDQARVGLAATLMATSPVLILPISHWLLKERITLRAVLGGLVAVAGIFVIVQ